MRVFDLSGMTWQHRMLAVVDKSVESEVNKHLRQSVCKKIMIENDVVYGAGGLYVDAMGMTSTWLWVSADLINLHTYRVVREIHKAIQQWDNRQIMAWTLAGDERSKRLMEWLGFRRYCRAVMDDPNLEEIWY